MSRLLLNAFLNNSVSHSHHGLWAEDDTQQARYQDLAMWADVVAVLERGCFDGIFWADNIGLNTPYRGGHEVYASNGIFLPINDPAVLAAALIAHTEHLGLFVTSSVVQEHPFQFARKMSTLDHLSGGRVAWNIVTSSIENTFRNFGHDGLVPHDERYLWAEEYLEVVYHLWEGSWEDGAVLRDRGRRVYADINRIHSIDHVGARYRVAGPHLAEPSLQRTPLLAQAGTSTAGRALAARHAEVQLISAASPEAARAVISQVRAASRAAGRHQDDIRVMQALSVVVGSTEDEAKRRSDQIDRLLSVDGVLAHLGAGLPIDVGEVPPDTPLTELDLETQGNRTWIQSVIGGLPDGQRATLADLVRLFFSQNRLVGAPEQIADALEDWQAAGVDGINLLYSRLPGSYSDFVDHVVPILQRRGIVQSEYRPGTLREKIFGAGPRLPDRHPAARFRRS